LKDHAQPPTFGGYVRCRCVDLLPVHEDAPAGRALQPCDASKRCRLAATAWPQQADDFSMCDRKIDATNGFMATERLPEADELDRRHAGRQRARFIERHWERIAAYCNPLNKLSLRFVEDRNSKAVGSLRSRY